MNAGRPCAGGTGTNLDAALSHLIRLEPGIFPSRDRYHYLITNAWPQIEFDGQTNRSGPTWLELVEKDNIARLYGEIAHLDFIVACGNESQVAVKLCVEYFGLRAKVAYANHTATRALCRKAGQALPKQIETWAYTVAYQLSEFAP